MQNLTPTTDLAAAVWALHVAIKTGPPVRDELRDAARVISQAAWRLFPKDHNTLRMRGYYSRMTDEQRAHRKHEQVTYNRRWAIKNPDRYRDNVRRAQRAYRARKRGAPPMSCAEAGRRGGIACWQKHHRPPVR